MSEKSQVTRTSKNVFEKSNSKTQYFVCEVKGRRMTKNGVEFERMPNEVVIRACYGGIFDEGAGKRANVLCQRRDEGW